VGTEAPVSDKQPVFGRYFFTESASGLARDRRRKCATAYEVGGLIPPNFVVQRSRGPGGRGQDNSSSNDPNMKFLSDMCGTVAKM
jgi:hypothetical protein